MAQMSGTSGWKNYNGGHLHQRFDHVDVDNYRNIPGIDVSEQHISLGHVCATSRGSAAAPSYLSERPPPIVLPSISQLSDMMPVGEYSFQKYRPDYPAVIQNPMSDATMMPSIRTTLSGSSSASPTENQIHINPVYQGNREQSHDMHEMSRLPALNLNFNPRAPILNDRVIPAPEQSVAESRISPLSNVEVYHSDELNQQPNPYNSSPTNPVALQQRPVIIRHNVHTHQCDRCPSRFTRAGELKRHYKMHLPERRMFHCWIAGCDRNGEKGFYRSDKFRDHQRKAHRCGKMLGNRGVDG